jgi:beta-lactamase class A
MLRSRFIIALLAAAASSQFAHAIDNSSEARIAEIEKTNGPRIGIVAIDSKSGRRIEHRPDERFPMCSTFKLLAVSAVLQRIDQAKEKLDRFVPYGEKDLLEYAPVTRLHVQEGGMTLGALCQAAIEQSDNTAANLVLQTIGGPNGVTQFARSLGDTITRLDRKEPELNDWRPNDERDTTSPSSMCEDLRRLLQTELLSKESRSRLDNWLQHNETGAALIRAGIPAGWRVGDKTGRSRSGATNDVAVIYPPDGAPIFVAIYIFNSSTSDDQRSVTISSLAGVVCEAFRPALTK